MRRFVVISVLGVALTAGMGWAQPSASSWAKVNEKRVTVPAGAMLNVRMIDRASSEKNQTGDRFKARWAHQSLSMAPWPSRRAPRLSAG